MYVRKKFVSRGEKTYGPYWVVVRSTRVDGRPRQRVVANIGPAEDYEEADRIARRKGILRCVPGCGEAADVELGAGTEYQPFYRPRGGRGGQYPFVACFGHSRDYLRGEFEEAHPAVLRD